MCPFHYNVLLYIYNIIRKPAVKKIKYLTTNVYRNFPARKTLERVQGRRKFSKIFKIYSKHRFKVI